MTVAQKTNDVIKEPAIPGFSVGYMDLSTDPHVDFFRYSVGEWVRTNQVPSDKSLWTAFDELYERNLHLLRSILEECSSGPSAELGSTGRLVGDLYKSAMNTKRIDEQGFRPILDELRRVEASTRGEDLARCIAELRTHGMQAFFASYSQADKKNSSVYALYLDQGGLSLPDREYYLAESFAEVRDAYRVHISRMFAIAGEKEEKSKQLAEIVLDLETELAKNSRSRADLRDEEKNYNKITISELDAKFPSLHLPVQFEILGVPSIEYVVIGQPEFFAAVEKMLSEKPIDHLRMYLKWCILHTFAPFLHSPVEKEDFEFFHHKLLGQQEPEARWKRATRVIDQMVGEALGRIYVERHFPPEAKRRVSLLIEDIQAVFRERLRHLPWMTEATRHQALEKFDKFRVKIGHPERFRDYSSIVIDPEDYIGNIRRAAAFETRRQASRVGQPVDRNEWYMTPPTVNAYFSPTENEIVFPAGILQPPYFDFTLDDAVNYASIGAVIGHEITHGYDDQGRKFDGDGNLRDWWTSDDEREFQKKARAVAELYSSQEPLPGVHVNGELTLGENIADFGGVSLAFEALQRRLAKEPAKRQKIDGLTPEQRFFIAWAQIWRINIREEEMRHRLTVDPHSPNRYRATLPTSNHPAFHEAFSSSDKKAQETRRLVAVW
ncbi:MAG: M13 family metallopeptidase [Nitrososphaerota archaeon]|nr:M13 family metallopeptidase [Nitrososphaerota archaeon]